jgi:hypothetical protein
MSIMQFTDGVGITDGARFSSMSRLWRSSKSHLFRTWIGVQRQRFLQNGQRMIDDEDCPCFYGSTCPNEEAHN